MPVNQGCCMRPQRIVPLSLKLACMYQSGSSRSIVSCLYVRVLDAWAFEMKLQHSILLLSAQITGCHPLHAMIQAVAEW